MSQSERNKITKQLVKSKLPNGMACTIITYCSYVCIVLLLELFYTSMHTQRTECRLVNKINHACHLAACHIWQPVKLNMEKSPLLRNFLHITLCLITADIQAVFSHKEECSVGFCFCELPYISPVSIIQEKVHKLHLGTMQVRFELQISFTWPFHF